MNKKDLYVLYVEEKLSDKEIANKFNKEEKYIREMRQKWNININQRFMADFQEIKKLYKKFRYIKEIENILQEYVGIPRFFDLYIPILEKLKDQEIHSLAELLDLGEVDYEVSAKEESIAGETNPTLYYRVNWCIFQMLKDKTIEEDEEKEYRITEKGISLYNEQENVKKIKLKEIDVEEQYKKLEEIIPSKKRKRKAKSTNSNIKINRKPIRINFEKLNERKKKIGDFCEEMIFLKEKAMVINAGREDLLDQIIWTSKEIGDGMGYDIESVRKIGDKYEKVYIEVKGTDRSNADNFYVTINELKASWELKDKYFICQVTDARKQNPKFKYTQGEIDKNFELKEILYQASNKIEL